MSAAARVLIWDGRRAERVERRPGRPKGHPRRSTVRVPGPPTPAFGHELARLRRSRPPAPGQTIERRHRSLWALAVEAGTGVSMLSRIEHGTRLPSLPLLARIAAALALSCEELAALVALASDDRS